MMIVYALLGLLLAGGAIFAVLWATGVLPPWMCADGKATAKADALQTQPSGGEVDPGVPEPHSPATPQDLAGRQWEVPAPSKSRYLQRTSAILGSAEAGPGDNLLSTDRMPDMDSHDLLQGLPQQERDLLRSRRTQRRSEVDDMTDEQRQLHNQKALEMAQALEELDPDDPRRLQMVPQFVAANSRPSNSRRVPVSGYAGINFKMTNTQLQKSLYRGRRGAPKAYGLEDLKAGDGLTRLQEMQMFYGP